MIDSNSWSCIIFQALFFTWFRITFLSFLKFPEIERENLISWGWGKGGTYSPEQLSYLVLPSVFQFLKFKELKIFIIYYISKSFTWFRITFLSFLEFPLIDEEGGPSFLGETNPAEWLNYLSPSPPPPPLLHLNFKHLKDWNSLSFVIFQCFLHDSEILFSVSVF